MDGDTSIPLGEGREVDETIEVWHITTSLLALDAETRPYLLTSYIAM